MKLEQRIAIASARLQMKQGASLSNVDTTYSQSGLTKMFRANPKAKDVSKHTLEELQTTLDDLMIAQEEFDSLGDFELARKHKHNTIGLMSAMGMNEVEAKALIEKVKTADERKAHIIASEIFDRLNEAITDEDLARYIDEYKEIAREKLIIINYISEIIVGKCNSPKDFVALSKYEARQFRLLRKKSGVASQAVTDRTNKNKSETAYEKFQKNMRS